MDSNSSIRSVICLYAVAFWAFWRKASTFGKPFTSSCDSNRISGIATSDKGVVVSSLSATSLSSWTGGGSMPDSSTLHSRGAQSFVSLSFGEKGQCPRPLGAHCLKSSSYVCRDFCSVRIISSPASSFTGDRPQLLESSASVFVRTASETFALLWSNTKLHSTSSGPSYEGRKGRAIKSLDALLLEYVSVRSRRSTPVRVFTENADEGDSDKRTRRGNKIVDWRQNESLRILCPEQLHLFRCIRIFMSWVQKPTTEVYSYAVEDTEP
mmetsp:Transcript_13616/g.30937  ORF Transcript_13616/g.30937 Transcript_13616/m.30937 type:complete len:267 (-) Transcript_13616:146-946(-)